jgi:hypothetical protein
MLKVLQETIANVVDGKYCGLTRRAFSEGPSSWGRDPCRFVVMDPAPTLLSGKQSRSLRRIPLRARVVEAIEAAPRGFGATLVFTGDHGGHVNLQDWRRDEWHPALEAAGLPKLPPYAMRHTFASFAIAAGVSLFYLARVMGTSVEQIDKTCGHLLPNSEEYLRGLHDTFDAATEEAVSATHWVDGNAKLSPPMSASLCRGDPRVGRIHTTNMAGPTFPRSRANSLRVGRRDVMPEVTLDVFETGRPG